MLGLYNLFFQIMKNNIQKADMFTQLFTASVKPNLPVNQIYLEKKNLIFACC